MDKASKAMTAIIIANSVVSVGFIIMTIGELLKHNIIFAAIFLLIGIYNITSTRKNYVRLKQRIKK